MYVSLKMSEHQKIHLGALSEWNLVGIAWKNGKNSEYTTLQNELPEGEDPSQNREVLRTGLIRAPATWKSK